MAEVIRRTLLKGAINNCHQVFKKTVNQFKGEIKKQRELFRKHKEEFDLDIMYFDGRVQFSQIIKIKTGI